MPPPAPPPPPPPTQVVSSVDELYAALGDRAVGKIVVAPGTYDLDTDDVCSESSAICINRPLTIEAQQPGSVVFDAKSTTSPMFLDTSAANKRRVIEINATAELIGINITGGFAYGGYAGGGLAVSNSEADVRLSTCNIVANFAFGSGGGLDVYGASVTLTDCIIAGNGGNSGIIFMHLGIGN